MIGATFFLSGIPWETFMVVTSLASVKTVWDHSQNSVYHVLHHTYPMCNFEQPFFHFWDRLGGTLMHEPPVRKGLAKKVS